MANSTKKVPNERLISGDCVQNHECEVFQHHAKMVRKVYRDPDFSSSAAIAQLGERQTEDLKVPGSIPGGGNFFVDR